ncbi:MAG: Ig-like domain-containing protein [Gemmatimonadota bacterium]
MLSRPHLRSCRHFLAASATLATILAAGCLVPTDGGGGPFGELRVRPTFTAGNDPGALQIHIDSIRTLVTASDRTPLADTIQPYDGADTLTWMLGLQADSETVEIRLELRSGEAAMYQGTGQAVVGSNGLGSVPVNGVPVDYVGPPLVRRVQVTPDRLAFASIGTSQRLDGMAYDANDDSLPDATLHWTSDDHNVATVDPNGLVTSTGVGSTLVVASANGAADTASISVDTTLARSTTIAFAGTTDAGHREQRR